MLYTGSVSPLLRQALDGIMQIDSLSDFRLVGGTALALQIGHRRSVDIDLFSDKQDFQYDFLKLHDDVKEKLKGSFQTEEKEVNKYGVSFKLVNTKGEKIKTDIYKWPFSFMKAPLREEKIRMAHLDDIVAMKLEAISDRNNYRDYVDISFLSERYTLSEMFDLYVKRTLNNDSTSVIKCLGNPENLVRDQKFIFTTDISEQKIKEKITHMLYVYTKEQEAEKRKKFDL